MHKSAVIFILPLAIAILAAHSHADEHQTPKLTIQFLTKDQARSQILQEKIEPYFALLTVLDMNAKLAEPMKDVADDKILPAFKARYQQAMMEFTAEEKAAITACLEELKPTFAKHFPLLLKTPWRFIKKSDSIESGAHFTREDCIVLSEGYTRVAANWHQRMKDGSVKPAAFYLHIARLLLHEQTHVLQRLYPDRFAEHYTKHWGFIRATNITSHKWIQDRRAVNPDGVDLGWVFPLKETNDGKTTTRYLWPHILYTKTDGHPRLFRDTIMTAVELEKTKDGFKVRTDEDGVPVNTPLKSLPAYTQNFPWGGAYHPNEAAAGELPMIVFTKYMPPQSTDEKDLKRGRRLDAFRAWAKKHLQ